MVKVEKIAKSIIGVGIILWLIQESATFFTYWKNPHDFFNEFFLMMMVADLLGIFVVLVFLVSQYLKKGGRFLSFLAQIVLYLHVLVIISGHIVLASQFIALVVVSSAMILFLLVFHIIHEIKKRNQEGYLIQIQTITIFMVAIFDLILGHGFRYTISEDPIRLGVTFLPVILEFVLTMAFVLYLLLKSSLAEKTRKIIVLVLSSIGVFGLLVNFLSLETWDIIGLPIKIAGDIVIAIGVVFYLILSLKSLKNFFKMEEQNISKQQ